MAYRGLGPLSGVEKDQYRTLAFRSIMWASAMISVVSVVQYLPMTILMVIMNTAPFLVALLTFFWMATRVTSVEIAAMVISYAAIIVITFSEKENS
jgi:drug/metabolite transporter (DMT)-like permease